MLKEKHFILKVKHEEDIIINVYVPNYSALKYMKQSTLLKTDKLTIIVRNINTPLSVFNIDKTKKSQRL